MRVTSHKKKKVITKPQVMIKPRPIKHVVIQPRTRPMSEQVPVYKPAPKRGKGLLIALITVCVLMVLVLLFIFGQQFVGKAITPATQIIEGNAGIFLDDKTVGPEETFIIPIMANIGAKETVALEFKLNYQGLELNGDCADAVVSILEYDWGRDFEEVSCDTAAKTISFKQGTIDWTKAKTGTFQIATVEFAGVNAIGQYPLTFTQFDIIDLNSESVDLINNGLGESIIVQIPGTIEDDVIPEDIDGDGYTLATGDCNDADPQINPGTVEVCITSMDDNCNGQVNENCAATCPVVNTLTATQMTCVTERANIFGLINSITTACVNNIATAAEYSVCSEAAKNYARYRCYINYAETYFPADQMEEVFIAVCGITTTPTVIDADGDGYNSPVTGGNDCNDADAAINPGAIEVCGNSIDEDCDGTDVICPQATLLGDADGDGCLSLTEYNNFKYEYKNGLLPTVTLTEYNNLKYKFKNNIDNLVCQS